MSGKIEIYDQDGKVIFKVPKGSEEIVIEEEVARQMGEALCKSAYTAKYGIAPGDNLVSETLRNKLVTRPAHIIKNLQSRKVLPLNVAQEVVDTVLSEVT